MTIPKNSICLWYDKEAEAAAEFYASVFPDSKVVAVHRAPRIDVAEIERAVAG